jgi:hypothetical protein
MRDAKKSEVCLQDLPCRDRSNIRRMIKWQSFRMKNRVLQGVVDHRIGFDLNQPLGVDEPGDLHDGIGGSDVLERIRRAPLQRPPNLRCA